MGPFQPSTRLRARRVVLLCAALALIAAAAFVLVLLSAPHVGVGATVSSTAVPPPPTAPHGAAPGIFRRSPPYASPPVTVGPATATAAAATAAAAAVAQATSSARASATAQAAPRGMPLWVGIGSNRTGWFTITGHAWKVELRCSGTPNAMDVIVRAFDIYGGYDDQLEYRCPAGLSGDMNLGTASATFHGTGRFYLYVDSGTNTNVVWEVTVTDTP